jgi:signal transduction histidine kinase
MMPAEGTPPRLSRAIGSRADVGGDLLHVRPYSALLSEIEELSARVEELESRKDAVEGFAAVAAHELMEPLVMTEAYASLIGQRLLGEEHADARRELDALGRGAARSRRLVETLLHDARSKGSPLQRRTVELDDVLDGLLTMFTPEVELRGATVDIRPLPQVEADELLIGALFQNLLANALKYSPRDGSRIIVDARRGAGEWHFDVFSDGPAIPPEEQERIFRPYSRARGERRARGAGLGLTICRSIVERHGGTISVHAGPGDEGNCFSFSLPDA